MKGHREKNKSLYMILLSRVSTIFIVYPITLGRRRVSRNMTSLFVGFFFAREYGQNIQTFLLYPPALLFLLIKYCSTQLILFYLSSWYNFFYLGITSVATCGKNTPEDLKILIIITHLKVFAIFFSIFWKYRSKESTSSPFIFLVYKSFSETYKWKVF